jgi:hypothetical protein
MKGKTAGPIGKEAHNFVGIDTGRAIESLGRAYPLAEPLQSPLRVDRYEVFLTDTWYGCTATVIDVLKYRKVVEDARLIRGIGRKFTDPETNLKIELKVTYSGNCRNTEVSINGITSDHSNRGYR